MKKWYDKGMMVAFACFIFPPVGIYALWKSSTIERNGKIIFGLVALIWMSVPFMGSNEAKTIKQESAIVDTAKAMVQNSGPLYASKEDSIKAYNEAVKSIQNSKNVANEQEESKEKDRIATEQVEHPEKYISFVNYNVYKGGFGNVAMLDCKLKNESDWNYKDIVIRVTFLAESGTEVGKAQEKLLINLNSKSTKKVRDFNLGFVSQQFSKFNIEVVSASIAN